MTIRKTDPNAVISTTIVYHLTFSGTKTRVFGAIRNVLRRRTAHIPETVQPRILRQGLHTNRVSSYRQRVPWGSKSLHSICPPDDVRAVGAGWYSRKLSIRIERLDAALLGYKNSSQSASSQHPVSIQSAPAPFRSSPNSIISDLISQIMIYFHRRSSIQPHQHRQLLPINIGMGQTQGRLSSRHSPAAIGPPKVRRGFQQHQQSPESSARSALAATPTAAVLVDLDNVLYFDSRPDVPCLRRRWKALRQELYTTYFDATIDMFCNSATLQIVSTTWNAGGSEKDDEQEAPSKAEDLTWRGGKVAVHATRENSRDGADHALLSHLERRCLLDTAISGPDIVVVTADKTLARAAYYMCSPGHTSRLRFCTFDRKTCPSPTPSSPSPPPRRLSRLRSYTPPATSLLQRGDRFGLSFNDRKDLDGFIDFMNRFRRRYPERR